MKNIVDSLEEIEGIVVHWSESEYINNVLIDNDDGDIEKQVDIFSFDSIINLASKEVGTGYDKTSLSITLKNKIEYKEVKFYLTSGKDSLLKLLNGV
jgi:hypothetical protein